MAEFKILKGWELETNVYLLHENQLNIIQD